MENFKKTTVERANVWSDVDAGLRTYLVHVYNYMLSGLLVTGLTSHLISQSAALMQAIFGTPLFYLVAFAPLIMVFVMSSRINKMSAQGAQLCFWGFAALMGISLASIFMVYTGHSIAQVFLITAATFGAMSLYGYTTKKDLTSWGSFLFMGVIGIVIASVVNLFMQSSQLSFIVSILGVIIFTGLTAYDTQMIVRAYNPLASRDSSAKQAIFGALQLYLDFINLFLSLLRLLGDRR